MGDIEENKLEEFVKQIMIAERRYSTDQKGQKSNRLSEIRECLDKFVAKEISDENKEN